MNTKDNARSKNTEKILEETYLYLISKHPQRPVNVVELCAKAKVNRATFYAHYTDMLQLQEEIEKRIAKEVIELLKDPELGENIMTESRMTMILKYIKKNKNFYNSWYRSDRDESPLMINRILKNDTSELGLYRVLYCRAGINAIIKSWLENSCNLEEAHLAQIIVSLSKY